MIFEDGGLFLIVPSRSWPFEEGGYYDGSVLTHSKEEYQDFRLYGRRITLPEYSENDLVGGDPADAVYSFLSFMESGQTIVINGGSCLPGTVVWCQPVNGQWHVVLECFVAMPLQVRDGDELDLPDGSTAFEQESTLYASSVPGSSRMNFEEYIPYTIELVTTGDYKDVLDGLYTLFSFFEQLEEKRSRKSYGCIDPRMNGKAGASLSMEITNAVYDGVVTLVRKLTVTHEKITTTVYEGREDRLTKTSGDATLPDDVYYRFVQTGNMPLWFELDTGSSLPIDGLYTLWPGYWENVTDAAYAESKGYLHRPDGSRQTAGYSLGYAAGSQEFTLAVTIAGDSFSYVCDLADFSFVNGSRIEFSLQSDLSTDPGLLPEKLTILRPFNGYCRTVRKDDQL